MPARSIGRYRDERERELADLTPEGADRLPSPESEEVGVLPQRATVTKASKPTGHRREANAPDVCVMRRFKAKTGVTLERERSLDFPGARTFFQGPTAWGLPGAPTRRIPASERLFGDFSLSVIDPKCPALIEWLGAEGEAGAGGLVWHHISVYGGSCWTGDKRYPHSNLVVGWYASGKHACGHLVDSSWRRLNRVLTEITRAG